MTGRSSASLAPSNDRLQQFKRAGVRALIGASVLLLLVWTLGPIYWMVVTSISDGKDLLSAVPQWVPLRPTLSRYQAIFGSGGTGGASGPGTALFQALLHSLLVAGATTLVCLFLGQLAAYAMSRLKFRGKQTLMLALIAAQMLPAVALVIPLFFMVRNLGLVDTPAALILTYAGFTLPYVVWVLTGYVNAIPYELEEAALLDGCNRLQTMVHVTLPLAVPGLVAVGIFSFLISWNEFLYALTFTYTSASKTLPVVISEFSTQFGLDYGMVSTGGVITSIPPVLLALVFQRHIVGGLSAGAIKG